MPTSNPGKELSQALKRLSGAVDDSAAIATRLAAAHHTIADRTTEVADAALAVGNALRARHATVPVAALQALAATWRDLAAQNDGQDDAWTGTLTECAAALERLARGR